jgi:predicted deoxyguanosinetriphosphate triphosphohydrolase
MPPTKLALPTARLRPISEHIPPSSTESNEEPITRSPFEHDCDKISFSNAFFRLSGKTQVVPLAEDDHTHNRATHSKEVSCVARSIIHVLVNAGVLHPEQCEDMKRIVEAASLAHDIGNPPFGHDGEAAFRQWWSNFSKNLSRQSKEPLSKFEEFTHFEGNAIGFTMLLEMNVTSATLLGYTKYPITPSQIVVVYAHTKKNGVLEEDLPVLQSIWKKLGYDANTPRRHPLAYVVEAADDICNFAMDVKDAWRHKVIDLERLIWHYKRFFENVMGSIAKKMPTLNAEALSIAQLILKFIQKEGNLFESKGASVDQMQSIVVRLGVLRASFQFAYFGIESLISGNLKFSLMERIFPDEYAPLFYHHSSFLRQTIKGISAINKVMDCLVKAVMWKYKTAPSDMSDSMYSFLQQQYFQHAKAFKLLPESLRALFDETFKYQMDLDGYIYKCVMGIAFYVFGMTDHYVIKFASEIEA